MQIVWPRPNRKPGSLEGVALIGLIGLLLARFVPIARLPFWGCSFRRTTGLPCPGCGLTRVADHVSHFDFPRAFDANPLGALAACLFLVAIVLSALHLLFALPVPEIELSRRDWQRLGWMGAALLVVNYAFVLGRAVFP